MLDFGLLPPEVNSGRMYSGPGAGPLLAAAEAWDGLAFDLGSASAGYGSTISELTGNAWTGPTSLAMTAAVTPYVNWLTTTAGQAEETAIQARAAVAAYEAAFAMTVPPPVIAANRALLMSLIATNFFGQNTPGIMATEAFYVEMWAQDAAAMYGYAGASTTAMQVTPFAAPPQTANQDGVSGQADAVAKAAAAPAGQAATVGQQAVASAPSTTAQTAASTTAATTTTTTTTTATTAASTATTTTTAATAAITGSDGLGLGLTNANLTTFLKQTLQAYFGVGLGNFGFSVGQQLTFGAGTTAGSGGAFYATPQFASFVASPGGGPISAGAGNAGNIGRLRVPPNWHGGTHLVSATEVDPEFEENSLEELELTDSELAGAPAQALASTSHAVPAAAASQAAASGGATSNGVLGGIPMGGSSAGRGGFVVRYGFRHTVMPRPPSAG